MKYPILTEAHLSFLLLVTFLFSTNFSPPDSSLISLYLLLSHSSTSLANPDLSSVNLQNIMVVVVLVMMRVEDASSGWLKDTSLAFRGEPAWQEEERRVLCRFWDIFSSARMLR